MILHLGANGNIISQKAHYGTLNGYVVYNNDMVVDANNQYSCWGYRFVSGSVNGNPFAFYQTDSSVNIASITVLDCNGYGANTWAGGAKLLCRANNGAHYGVQPMNTPGNPSHKMVVCYFNATNQFVWARHINIASDSAANPMSIIGTDDNGCIVAITRMHDLGPYHSTAFIKFDMNGNTVWTKCVGDITSSQWRYDDLGSMINNGNGSIDLFMNHVFAIDMVKANQQFRWILYQSILQPGYY